MHATDYLPIEATANGKRDGRTGKPRGLRPKRRSGEVARIPATPPTQRAALLEGGKAALTHQPVGHSGSGSSTLPATKVSWL